MKLLLFTNMLFSGLISGLLFAYSCSVNPGLKALPDSTYLRAMQSINAAIQNPLFFIVFMGLLVLFPVTGYQLHARQTDKFYWFATAGLLYFIGVFGVTVFGNVPLNEQLARLPIESSDSQALAQFRYSFESSWNFFHTVRTLAALTSFALTLAFTVQQKW